MSTSSASHPQEQSRAAAPSGNDVPAQSPAPIPRPPNAWILYRSHKIEQLRREELRLAAQEQARGSQREPTTPAKGHTRRSSSGGSGLKRGALTASALAALGGPSQDGDPSPTKPFFGAFEDRRSRVGSPTPSLSSTLAPSSSFIQPPSTSTSVQEPSSASGMTASTNVPISTLLAQMWKSEPESVKSTFKDMAKRKEAEHKQAYPEYKYTPRVTEKSIKARQKAKGVRKIATGRVHADVSGEQEQVSHRTRSASPKRQRYPPPQASPRKGLRSARGQGSPDRDGDFRRSLSPMREAARPYPTLTSPVDSRPDNKRVAPQASDDCTPKTLRRSPRFRQAAAASLTKTNGDCATEAPGATTKDQCVEIESVKADELMNCFAKAVDAQSQHLRQDQSQHRATVSTPFSTIASPWSPTDPSSWTRNDSRGELDYDMHSYLADQSLEGSYAAASMGQLSEGSFSELVSPSHAALGFFAPPDETGMEGDESIVEVLHDKQSYFDRLPDSYMPGATDQVSPWKDSYCGHDLSLEYLSEQPSGMQTDDFIRLQDVSWRKRRHPQNTLTSLDMDESAGCTTQLLDRESLQCSEMSYMCSSSTIDRQNSTRTITQTKASQENTHAHNTQERSFALMGSKASQSELPDYSLPLELIDFSFDHRDGDTADDNQLHTAMCNEAITLDGQDDSMITWADTEGSPAVGTSACPHEHPNRAISQMSPMHANSSPPWTRPHSKIAKYLLQQAGQEDTIPSVSSSNCTSPGTGLCGIESGSLNKTFGGEGTIEPSMTLTLTHGGNPTPKGSTNPPQRREGGGLTTPHRSTNPAVAKYDFLNSALPRSAQPFYRPPHHYGTSDTTVSSASSPLTSRTSHQESATSPMMSSSAHGPTSLVGERAAQWEALTRQTPEALRSPAKHVSKNRRVEGERSPRITSPTVTPSAADDRLELNGFYTEEELMDLLARRRMQRAAGREPVR